MFKLSSCSSHLLLNNKKFSISLKLGFLRLVVSLEQLNSTQLCIAAIQFVFIFCMAVSLTNSKDVQFNIGICISG